MRKIEGGLKDEVKYFKIYLRQKGIPANMIESIRYTFINEALAESSDMKYDRLYTALALATRRAFGFGHKRIMRVMQEFEKIMHSLTSEEAKEWEDIMEELDNETGIVIRTDNENRNRLVCDYMGKTYRRAHQIEEAERKSQMDKCEDTL